MSQLRAFCAVGKLILTAFKRRTVGFANSVRITGRTFYFDSYNFKNLVTNDALLYTLEKPKRFMFINAMSFANLIFWTHIGYFMYVGGRRSDIHSRVDFLEWLYNNERKYSEVLGAISVFFGVIIFMGAIFFTKRSVRSILLHKGGRKLTITTYTLFGSKKAMTLPVAEVSASLSRERATSFIPLKIKNKYFYFLVDVCGDFKNPLLFDCTAGIARNF